MKTYRDRLRELPIEVLKDRISRQRSVGTGGFGRSGRRRSSMMLMAAMLAATAGGIGLVMADDRKYY